MVKLLSLFMSLLSVLCSCNSQTTVEETEKYKFIDSLSLDDLETLRGVNIAVRNKEDAAYSFGILLRDIYYRIPAYDTLKEREIIMNPNWYDVVKYAKANNVDSTQAYDFVKIISDKITSVFHRANVYSIKQDASLGDFVIFELSSPEIDKPKEKIICLYPSGEIRHQYWKDYFTKAEKIKDGWYK